MRPLIIDNFAGGGGASTGLEAAFGRPVDVAVNHDEAAIAVHAANHPHTRHLCQSIMSIDPLDATGGAPVLLVWFSPDCKHHSKAKGGKHAAVAAFMAQHNTGMVGHPADAPLSTIVHRGTQQQLVQTTLVDADALPADMLNRAVRTAAFLIKYYGNDEDGHSLVRPLGTVTTRDRFAVVTVTIDTATYVLVDIGMRMLTPPELKAAQGFPAGYKLDPVCWYVTDSGNRKYGPLPKSHQIAKIGNSVCPNMSEVLARANLPEHCTGYQPEAVAA